VNTQGLWQLLHLFFAFSYVGSLVVAEWNGRAARATQDWAQRALLFHIVYLSSRIAGAGALFLTGVLGHLTAVTAGMRMAHDRWLWWVTGLWLLALAGMFLINVPNAARLAATARQAAAGGSSEGYTSALARWRFGNVVQSVLYLALLALMVFRGTS
jgi:hypothetical protein